MRPLATVAQVLTKHAVVAQEAMGDKSLPSCEHKHDRELQQRKLPHKLTRRKKTDPCMESQPLACGISQPAKISEQQDNAHAASITQRQSCTDSEAAPADEPSQAAQAPAGVSSREVLAATDVLSQEVRADVPSEKVPVATAQTATHEAATDAEVDGSLSASLAVIPPSDDEVEVGAVKHPAVLQA